MSANDGSADGVFSQQSHEHFDLNQQVKSEPEVNSITSDNLSELQSSMESMISKELEGEEIENGVQQPIKLEGEEMENGVQQPIKNEDMVLEFEQTVPNPTYRAATPPAPPPPSPSSLISTLSRDEVSSGEFVPSYVVMGCTRCYIYVLVSEVDPKCPKCKSYDLLNEFRGSFGLCKRKKN